MGTAKTSQEEPTLDQDQILRTVRNSKLDLHQRNGYYGRYAPSALSPLLRYVDQTLVAWAQRKFKRFERDATVAGQFVEKLATEPPNLFGHWQLGMTGTFV